MIEKMPFPPSGREPAEKENTSSPESKHERYGDIVRSIALFLTLWAENRIVPVANAGVKTESNDTDAEVRVLKEKETDINGYKTLYRDIQAKETKDGVRFITDGFIIGMNGGTKNSKNFGAGIYKTRFINTEEWTIHYYYGDIPDTVGEPFAGTTIEPSAFIIENYPKSYHATLYQEALKNIFVKTAILDALKRHPADRCQEIERVTSDIQSDMNRLIKNFGPASYNRERVEEVLEN